MLLSGASDLSPQIVKPPQIFQRLLTSCKLFSTTCISVHIFLVLLNSLFISFFSSQLLSTRVGSPHLSSTCPVFLSPVEVTQLQTFLFRPVELPFHSIMVFSFQHSIVLSFSCHVRSFNPTGLLPVGPTFKHAWPAAFFPRARRAVTSRAAICQERAGAAQPHASFKS